MLPFNQKASPFSREWAKFKRLVIGKAELLSAEVDGALVR
jgi:hypothetical protein